MYVKQFFFCFVDPEWASCNIGVFICLDCSGVHRGFGTDVSRVKSIRLDNWDGDQVQVINEFSKFNLRNLIIQMMQNIRTIN